MISEAVEVNPLKFAQLFHDGSPYHLEISPFFYMIWASVMKELMLEVKFGDDSLTHLGPIFSVI